MRLRTLFIALLVVVVVAFGALSVFWFIAKDQFAKGLVAWRGELESMGFLIAAGEPEIGGYPLSLEVQIAAPLLTLPNGERWEGPASVSGKAWLWDLETVVITAPGRHVLDIQRGPLALEAKEVTLTLGFAKGQFDRVALVLGQPTVTNEVSGRTLSVDRLAFDVSSLLPGADRSSDIAYLIEIEGLPLPPEAVSLNQLIGPKVELLRLAGTLRGLLVPGPMKNMVQAWSDSGGVLEFDDIELNWGELWMKGDGTFSLDSSYRPLGAFTFDTLGLIGLVRRGVEAGYLDAGAGETLTRALAALSTGEDEKGRQQVELPITMQDGTLYLGQIKTGSLRPLF